MAPVTRKSQAGGSNGIAKKVTRKRAPAPQVVRKESTDSWNFISTSNDDIRDSVEDGGDEQLAFDGPADVEEAVNPLREMADKVGKEVERFAITLDRFMSGLPTREDKHQAAIEVVSEFKNIAESAVLDLQKSHQKERRQQLRTEWSQQAQLSTASDAPRSLGSSNAGALSARKAKEVKELRHWQQEADIWELFRLILELRYRKDMDTLKRKLQQEREERLARLEQPHRYTTEAELYDRFLIESDVARERSLIKRWLEQTVDHQASDLPSIIEELEARSGSGKGLWSHGWINTREKIKGEKRLRTWPSASESVQPQIRSTTGEMLVTALDPDAPARQQRALEKPDSYYEKAVWIACWEMLRRGKPWQEIRKWGEERNEGWRAVALSRAIDPADSLSNGAWRKMCYLASESGCSNDYEAAVYGLLGGNIQAVEKVCRTVDDHLYAYYSVTLVRHFDLYLQQKYPDRLPSVSIKRGQANHALEDKDKAEEAMMQLIKKLQKDTATEESTKPMKVIQSYLLVNQAETMVYNTGLAASDLDSLRGEDQNMIVRLRSPPTEVSPEAQIIMDHHALRIAAHIYVVVRAIDDIDQPAVSIDGDENVQASYIQTLRTAGKRDLTPLYASTMQKWRSIVTMARVLQDVTQPNEQRALLNLMEGTYHMDVVMIFTEQLDHVLAAKLGSAAPVKRPMRILESTEISQLHPGQRIIENFLPDSLDDTDVAIVRSLQWFQLLHGHWGVTFSSLSLALRKCLVTGRFGCALEIVRNFPYESMSTLKSDQVIGLSVNIMDKNMPWPEAGSDEAIQWELLRRQSRTYYELEQLVHAIETLSEWVINERPYTAKPEAAGPPPSRLKSAKAEMDDAMAPLLAGILRNPIDEEEAEDLQHIRRTYLPEVIIAYNTALYTAGPTISRDSYIESMDLSVAIADETNDLAECFVQAGRMRELVTSFAQTSKLMLVMKGNGRSRKGNLMEKTGKDRGIWEIGSQGQGTTADHDAEVS